MLFVVYSNGCNSKYRKFRIVSIYQDEETKTEEYHHVEWRFPHSPVWHAYIVDAHYMDKAEFPNKQKAIEFVQKQVNPVPLRIEITEITE